MDGFLLAPQLASAGLSGQNELMITTYYFNEHGAVVQDLLLEVNFTYNGLSFTAYRRSKQEKNSVDLFDEKGKPVFGNFYVGQRGKTVRKYHLTFDITKNTIEDLKYISFRNRSTFIRLKSIYEKN